jgi:hypothetical protein
MSETRTPTSLTPDASDTADQAKVPERPKNLNFMVGWLVFLGVYQIFLAWAFGSFFEGTQGDLREALGGVAMEPIYAAVGVVALVTAWGGWHLKPWAYDLGWLVQGAIFALAIVIFVAWFAGKNVPVVWLIVDCLFGAYNVYFLTRPEVRRAFRP